MLSLSVNHVQDFLTKLGLDEFDTSNYSIDSSGDYIIVIDPDTDFSKVRNRILKNKALNKKVVNQGILFVELFDTLWIDGNRVKVAILAECGSGKIGTKVKIMVKSVDVLVKGQMKQFLGFNAYKNYLEIAQA